MERKELEKTSAASLPLDALVSIFQVLDTDSKGKAAQVCSSWREASSCKSIWTTDEVKIRSGNLNAQSEHSIIKRGIKRVDIGVFEPKINEFLRRIPSFEYLRITCCCVKEQLLKFFKTAPNSTEILKAVFAGNNQNLTVSDDILEIVAHKFPHLHKLNPHGCQYNSVHMLKTFTSGMKNLKVVHLYGCANSLIPSSYVGTSHTAEQDTQNEDQLMFLEELCFKNVLLLKKEAFHFIGQKCVNLTSLNFQWCGLDSDGGLVHLLPLKNLEHLSFVDTWGITDIGFGYISQFTNLKSLNLAGGNRISDRGFESISRLTNLMTLNFTDCLNVTDETLKFLNRLPQLRGLNLHRCPISDEGLSHLVAGSLKLEELDISCCPRITNKGLWYICGSSFILRNLNVSCCDVTDHGLYHIVERFSDLQFLGIASCRFVTDECKRKIIKKLHRNKDFKLGTIGEDYVTLQVRIGQLFSYLEQSA